MSLTDRELERFGEQFILVFESVGRVLNMYPASHPAVAAQCQRFVDNVQELRELSGEATFNLVNTELYVNGVPLKRLSLNHQEQIAAWELKGLELVSFAPELSAEAVVGFHQVIGCTREELWAAGGVAKALEDAGVTSIRAGRVTVGLKADTVSMVDGDVATEPEAEEDEANPIAARARFREAFHGLLYAVQGGASLDPRVRMVRNLNQVIESRLLERRAVRDLAARLREHDKESYRAALGGAVVAVLMGAALGVRPRGLRLLGEAALLRDMGKLKIAPDVLHVRDRDPATRAEFARHPALGAKLLLADREIAPTAAVVAYEHHARLDLKGYPKLTARSSLHAFSRIVEVASDYDRMTGGYPGVSTESVWDAVGVLVRGVGSAYDAAAVRAFLRVMGCVPEGTPVRLVDGREGIVAGPGRRSWLCPEVAILRDSGGTEVTPEIVETDALTEPGGSVIAQFLPQVTDRDRERLEALAHLD